jgi:hypothetical protein
MAQSAWHPPYRCVHVAGGQGVVVDECHGAAKVAHGGCFPSEVRVDT